jgi:transposase
VNKGRSNQDKLEALKERHALNDHPERVSDQPFVSGGDFFDTQDLVQVKYEMLRRVYKEDQSVVKTAAAFGFSRPSFYRTRRAFEAEGLPGLLPERPGPRRGHKLTPEVVTFLKQVVDKEPQLGPKELAVKVKSQFNLVVHPRSVQRTLTRRLKKLPRRKQ